MCIKCWDSAFHTQIWSKFLTLRTSLKQQIEARGWKEAQRQGDDRVTWVQEFMVGCRESPQNDRSCIHPSVRPSMGAMVHSNACVCPIMTRLCGWERSSFTWNQRFLLRFFFFFLQRVWTPRASSWRREILNLFSLWTFPSRSVAEIRNSFCCGTLPRLWHA